MNAAKTIVKSKKATESIERDYFCKTKLRAGYFNTSANHDMRTNSSLQYPPVPSLLEAARLNDVSKELIN